ncbi:MAG: efflux RND transporter permease subunit [Myxococcales bacterium]|nr:efflux RND transporter permease subunit [Myxococcales bacterium]
MSAPSDEPSADADDGVPAESLAGSAATPPDLHRGILAWFARNTVAANIIMLVLLVGGSVLAITGVKQEVFPEVEIDTVIVNVPYPGASPSEVESGVALAIEEAVQGLDGVKEVRTTATEGFAVVAVELLLGADTDRALNDVKSAVDRITSFPQDIERPVVALATNRRQVVSLILHGDVEDAERVLHDLAEQVRFDLLEKPEITYVEIAGTRPLEIAVEVPQSELRRHGLTLAEVAGAVRAASIEVPAGSLKTRSGDILLRTTERRERGSEYADITLRSRADGGRIRLGDIANIEDGFREEDRAARFLGNRAVSVDVFRVGDEGPIQVAGAVRRYLDEELSERLPPGVEAVIWNDTSELYSDRIDLLSRNAQIGLILVLIILGLFLEPRLAFWVTLGIPISFAGAMLFLPSAEVSINMISLFAFIVVLGMVVDDAIVVGESVHHKRSQGLSRMDAAVAGVKEVAVPVLFSITTTCVAFAPLLFVPGVAGKFFRNIPLVVISVLIVSLIESLVVLPAHLSHRMPWALRMLTFPLQALSKLRAERGLLFFIDRLYRPALQLALRWRYLTFAVAIAIGLGTCALPASGRLQFSFMPKVEGDTIMANLRMPVGTPVAETERLEARMVSAAREILAESGGDEILRGLYSQVGASMGAGGGPVAGSGSDGAHLASAMVYLVQMDQREITAAQFAERWRERIGEIAGAETLTFSYSIGASPGSPVDIRLSHPDPSTLEAAAERLAQELRSYPGLRDIDSGVSPGKEQLDVTLRPEGRARGLTESELARQLRDAFFGAEAVRQQRGREELRVYVRRPLSERSSMADIEQLVVRTPDGGEMPLAQAADVRLGRAYTTIRRTDGRRIVSVTADVVAGVGNANEILATARQRELPQLLADTPGLTYSMGGEQKEQAESLKALATGQLFALFVMYGLLAIVFRSYAQPLVVMLGAIPFGVTGAFLGHLMMGFDLSMISIMGIVALSGVVVNDSLVLIDAINRFRREEGMSAFEAVIAGGTRRFRPILLTSLTTFFGLMPMILEPSVQARFLVPMAISLGFGIVFATVILVFLVPSAYLIIEDLVRGTKRAAAAFSPAGTPRPSPASPAE